MRRRTFLGTVGAFLAAGAAAGAGVTIKLGDDGAAAAGTPPPYVLDDSWFTGLMAGLGATLLTDDVRDGIAAAWAGWRSPIADRLRDVGAHGGTIVYGQPYPPVAFVRLTADTGVDVHTDTLTTFVDGGTQTVVFPPWAWQALAHFVHDLTAGATGADRGIRRRLAAIALAPAQALHQGASTPGDPVSAPPDGPAGSLRYRARGGDVRITRLDAVTVQVSAAGDPAVDGTAARRRFRVSATPTPPG